MPKTHTPSPVTAKTANEDLRAELFYLSDGDPEAPTMEMWFRLRIAHEDGSSGPAPRVKVLDHCDPTTESMNACLVKCRDACFAMVEYI